MIKSNAILMKNPANKSSLWLALIFYWLLLAVLFGAALTLTENHFGYPQDDTYIHMAIAKHFVNDGFWGVSQFGFSSSTSSPLWTFLIALSYMIFGVNDFTPLVLSLISGHLIVIYCYSILKNDLSDLRAKLFLAAVILLTPLAMLSLSGMEHLLHGFLTISLLFMASEFIDSAQPDKRKLIYLVLLSGFITITRYEGLFLVFAISLVLLLQKRFFEAVLIGGAGLLPVTLYGLFSVSKGWYFLPNSLLIKGNTLATTDGGAFTFFQRLLDNILLAPHIPILVILCWGIYRWKKRANILPEKDRYLFPVFLIIALLHMLLAKVGWFYRYDAYIILTGILIIARLAMPLLHKVNSDIPKFPMIKSAALISLGVILFLPFAIRASLSHSQYPTAIKNIFEQQYQMALFIKKYYAGSVIAANDIGAINYLADVKTLDLYGLATLEVPEARRNKTYDAATIRSLVENNNVEIVMIYNSWFDGNLPPEWEELGRWEITNNIATANDVVSFYSPLTEYSPNAIAHLKDFEEKLPKDVIQSGLYTTRQTP